MSTLFAAPSISSKTSIFPPPLQHSASTFILASTSVSTPASSVGSCPRCGCAADPSSDGHVSRAGDEAQRRIVDLEAQVRLLNTKAAAAVDRLADYEDEIASLRESHAQLQRKQQNVAEPAYSDALMPPPRPKPKTSQSRLSTLSAFLPGRKREAITPDSRSGSADICEVVQTPTTSGFPFGSWAVYGSPNTPSNNSPLPSSAPLGESLLPNSPPRSSGSGAHGNALTLQSLQATLESERQLREKAEDSLTQAQCELEELTAQLFGQANEMVATERKARAKLEERVKTLETRDEEKRKRLEKLEKALGRIERVRRMVTTAEIDERSARRSRDGDDEVLNHDGNRTRPVFGG